MKNIYKFLCGLLFLSVFTISCQDDDEFVGVDNYITSFNITLNGNSIKSSIKVDTIKVVVPSNVDLTEAKIVFSLSEKATIKPDPSEVKNWNEKMSFVVTSFNGNNRHYVYIVEKEAIKFSGDVILESQTDIDEFKSLGVVDIDGNLIIGNISDQSGLNSIKTVSGDIIFKSSYSLGNCDGLSHLKSAGNIYVGNYQTKFSPDTIMKVRFQELSRVGEIVVNSQNVEELSLPSLISAYNIYVDSKSIDSIEMPNLKEVDGSLTLQSGTSSSTTTSNQVLKTINLPSIEKVYGSVYIQYFSSVNSLSMNKLSSVGENLQINYLTSLEDVDLDALQVVCGAMALKYNYMQAIVSVPEIERIGALQISGNNSYRNLDSVYMPKLKTIDGQMLIEYSNMKRLQLPELTSVGGLKLNYLEQLEDVNFAKLKLCPSFVLYGVYKLTSLDLSNIENSKTIEIISPYILSSLKLPEEIIDITMNGGTLSTTFPIVSGVKKVNGKFTLSNYNITKIEIASVEELSNLITTGCDVKDLSCPDLITMGLVNIGVTTLTTLSMPKLESIENVDFSNLWSLSNVTLSSLTKISGTLKFYGASYAGNASRCTVSDLNFLSTLTSIGSVDIKWCGSLKDFSGLKNALPSLSSDAWKVSGCKYNPSFEDMQNGLYTN